MGLMGDLRCLAHEGRPAHRASSCPRGPTPSRTWPSRLESAALVACGTSLTPSRDGVRAKALSHELEHGHHLLARHVELLDDLLGPVKRCRGRNSFLQMTANWAGRHAGSRRISEPLQASQPAVDLVPTREI